MSARRPVRTLRLVVAGWVVCLAAAGCARGATHLGLVGVGDPCELITDDLLMQLAPGARRVHGTPLPLGATSGARQCTVDLHAPESSTRGTLDLVISADTAGRYDEAWSAGRCKDLGTAPGAGGPGERSCFVARPWDGVQSRIDGWAWRRDDYEVGLSYQLLSPDSPPPGAEDSLRRLLTAAVRSLPAPA